jgi:endonuclease-3 related protein
MPSFDDSFHEINSALVERYGHSRAGSDSGDEFEMMAAVLLTRSLGLKKGRSVVDCLREASLLTADRLAHIDPIELVDVVRQGGISATAESLIPLKRLARWLIENHQGESPLLGPSMRSSDHLRTELSSIRGIGVAGADALLLHGLKRPSYPVDRSSLRILIRHGWADPSTTIDEVRDLFTDSASSLAKSDENEQSRILEGLSDAMSQVGRQYCRAAGPRCAGCPLESLLPEEGPLEVDS